MYEFITIGGGEYFVDIFNGLAMLVNSGDFLDVLKIAGTLAFMISLLNAALSGSLYDSGKWFLTTFIITQTLLYPKATIIVTDKTNPALIGAKVDNVPFVVVYVASTTSKISYALTKQFEAAYSLPDDLQYTGNGMIFGVNLWQSMQQARPTNANLASSLNSFSQNCIFYDIEFGIYSFDDLKKSEDIWNFIKGNQVENRFFTYTNQEGSTTTYPTCKAGAASMEADWQKQYQDPDLLKNIGFSASKPNLTKSVLNSATPLVTQYFFNVSKTSEQVLQQAMMINAINDATENFEAENQIQSYQNARATLQAKSTFQTMGTQAGMWIPILRIVIEVVFYGAFPLVILIAIIPGMTGSVLRGYFTTFFWLAAWGPLYAIFHRISMGHGKMYTLGISDEVVGLTLASQPALEQTMNSIAAMAGYMSMFIPMIAFGIARGGAAAMSSMTTSFMSGVQGAVSTAVHEGTTGNMSFGNVGIGERHAYSGVSIMNDAGQIINRHNDGSFSVDNSRAEDRSGMDLKIGSQIQASNSQAISSYEASSTRHATEAQTLRSQGSETMNNRMRAIDSSNELSKSMNSEESSRFSKIQSIANDIHERTGVDRSKALEFMGGISKGLPMGASIGANLSSSSREYKAYEMAKSLNESNNYTKDFASVESMLDSQRFSQSYNQHQSISDTMQKSASLSKLAASEYTQAQELKNQNELISSNHISSERSVENEFRNWAMRDKHMSQGEFLAMINPNNRDEQKIDQLKGEFLEGRVQRLVNDFQSDYNNTNLQRDYSHNQSHTNSQHGQFARQLQNESPYQFSGKFKDSEFNVENSGLSSEANNFKNNVNNNISNERFANADKTLELEGNAKDNIESGILLNSVKGTIETGNSVLVKPVTKFLKDED